MADTREARDTVARGLDAVAGALTEGPRTPAGALAEARRLLAAALAAGHAPEDIVPPRLAPHVSGLLAEGDAPGPATGVRGAPAGVRLTAHPGGLGFADRDLRARQVERLGPFLTPDGLEVDLVYWWGTVATPVVQGGRTVAVLPLPRLRSTRPVRRFAVGRGSAWIDAGVLTGEPGPAGAFSGLRVSAGQLATDSPATFSGGALVLAPGTAFTLDLTLDPPGAPSPTSPVGTDGSAAAVAYPESVRFRLGVPAPTAGSFTELAATACGGTTTLALEGGVPVTPLWDPIEHAVVVPLAPSSGDDLAAPASTGTALVLSGSAGIAGAGWALPAIASAPDALGTAAGVGRALIVVGPGLAVTSRGQVLTLARAAVTIAPGSLALLGSCVDGAAARYRVAPTPSGDDHGFVAWRLPPGALVLIDVHDGHEALFGQGQATAAPTLPVDVTGARLTTTSDEAALGWVRTSAGDRFAAAGETPHRPVTVALDNVLLGTRGAEAVVVNGNLDPGGQALDAGTILLVTRLTGVVLALPDPYATSQRVLPKGRSQEGTAAVLRVRWSATVPPAVALRMGGLDALPAADAFLAESAKQRGRATKAAASEGDAARSRAGFGPGLGLLDVSGAADIFGVQLGAGAGLDVEGMAVTGNVRGMALLAPPAVSWEPAEKIDQFGNDIGPSSAPTDGPPTRLNVTATGTVPVDPTALIKAQVAGVADGAHLRAEFSLPFGLVAEVGVNNPVPPAGVQLNLIRPVFTLGGTQPGGLPVAHEGGLQLRLEPRGTVTEVTGLDGTMVLATPAADNYAPPLFPTEVLTWLGHNSPVPIQRIDLSGWGESGFSHWLDPNPVKVGLVEARVEVLVGRASREILTFASFVWPWGYRVKRTFTFERQADGGILRFDSGWQAVDDGMFQAPRLGSLRPDTGPFLGVQRPTLILDTDRWARALPLECRVVTFNGDLLMSPDLVVRAGSTRHPGVTGTFVPATGLLGYLQVEPHDSDPTTTIALPPTTLAQLLHDDPLGATPLHCTVDLGTPGTPGMTMRVTGVEVGVSRNLKKVVPTLRGAPALPRSGAWTVGRREASTPAPVALGAGAPVPLVRAKTSDPWALADPADALNPKASSASRYSLIQGSSTQKALFELPTIPAGTAGPVGFDTSQLAHAGALLGAAGPFPSLLDGLDTIIKTLDVVAGTVSTPPSLPSKFPVTHAPFHLADFGPVHATFELGDVGASTTDAHLNLEPDGGWDMQLDRVRVCLSVDGMGSDPLVTVLGTIQASSSSAPSLSDIDVVYGGFLQPLTEIFTKLQALASFLPGSSPPGLDVSFAGGRLTVRDQFALPALPLGFGQITDVSLDLGATVAVSPPTLEFLAGIASPEQPFHWVLSPLAGTGCVEVGVRNGDLIFLIQAGLGLGLSIDVGIASGSASITLALQVDNKTAVVTITIILTGQASVDVLGGLASASLTLSAGLSISPNTLPVPSAITVGGDVGVGIHISICWVIDIDFDGSWHFEQSFSL